MYGKANGSTVTVLRADFGMRVASYSRNQDVDYINTQEHPCAGGAYGSSPLPTGPHTDGTW